MKEEEGKQIRGQISLNTRVSSFFSSSALRAMAGCKKALVCFATQYTPFFATSCVVKKRGMLLNCT